MQLHIHTVFSFLLYKSVFLYQFIIIYHLTQSKSFQRQKWPRTGLENDNSRDNASAAHYTGS